MKTIEPFRAVVASGARRGRTSWRAVFVIPAALLLPIIAIAQSATAVKAVSIVLPPKVVAGRPATLAVLGADGRLAPNVAVDLGAICTSPPIEPAEPYSLFRLPARR